MKWVSYAQDINKPENSVQDPQYSMITLQQGSESDELPQVKAHSQRKAKACSRQHPPLSQHPPPLYPHDNPFRAQPLLHRLIDPPVTKTSTQPIAPLLLRLHMLSDMLHPLVPGLRAVEDGVAEHTAGVDRRCAQSAIAARGFVREGLVSVAVLADGPTLPSGRLCFS